MSRIEYVDGLLQRVESTKTAQLRKPDGPLSFHPDYERNFEHMLLAQEAYYGTGGFLDGENLVRYSVREAEDKFKNERQDLAFYINYLRPAVNVFANAIFSQPPSRDANLIFDLEQAFKSNHGDRNETMEQACISAKLNGVALLRVFGDRREAQSLADEQEMPIGVSITNPLSVINWDLEGDEFNWVKVYSTVPGARADWRKPSNERIRVTVYDREHITTFDEMETSETGTDSIEWKENSVAHNLGMVPVIPMWPDASREPGQLYCPTEAWQAAKISKRNYNIESEIVEQQRASSFNLFIYPMDESMENPGNVDIGAKQCLGWNPQTGGEPKFICPSSEPIDQHRAVKEDNTKSVFQTFRLDADMGLKPSSVSATQRIYIGEETSKVIRALARQAQTAEIRVSKLLALAHGVKPEELDDRAKYYCEYNTKFDHSVLGDNIVNRFAVMAAMVYPSDTMNREQCKYIARHIIPLDDKTRKQIFKEIEGSPGVINFNASRNSAGKIPSPVTQHTGLEGESRGEDSEGQTTGA